MKRSPIHTAQNVRFAIFSRLKTAEMALDGAQAISEGPPRDAIQQALRIVRDEMIRMLDQDKQERIQ